MICKSCLDCETCLKGKFSECESCKNLVMALFPTRENKDFKKLRKSSNTS